MFAIITLAACSDDDVVGPLDPDGPQAIAFNVTEKAFNDGQGTRATVITNDNITSTDFEVWAFKSDGNMYMGTTSGGVQITHTTTSSSSAAADATNTGYWDYADQSEVAYWPDETLEFFAISPSQNSIKTLYNGKDYKSISINGTTRTVKLNFTDDTNKMFDFLYATTSASASPVSLEFKHALSQVAFTVTKQSSDMTATVTQLHLYNIYENGEFAVVNGTASWSNDDDLTQYQISPSSKVTIGTTATDITDSNGAIFLIPQSFDAATLHSGFVREANRNKRDETITSGGYIGMTCTVTDKNGRYVYGASGSDSTVAIPFAATWTAGNKYVYDLAIPDMEVLWSSTDCVQDAAKGRVNESSFYSTASTALGAAEESDEIVVEYSKTADATGSIELWLDESVSDSGGLLAKRLGTVYGDTYIGTFTVPSHVASKNRISLSLTSDMVSALAQQGSVSKKYGYQKLYLKYSGVTIDRILYKR